LAHIFRTHPHFEQLKKVSNLMEDFHSKLRIKCFEHRFHTFGHKYIFDERIKRYGQYISWLKVFGLIVPATFGAVAIGYGLQSKITVVALAVAIPATIVQFIFSILAVIYKWDDELTYSIEASQSYTSLYTSFEKLAEFPPDKFEELNKEFDLLNTEYGSRSRQDVIHNITDWELRKGMKFSLRQYQKECIECKITPTSLEDSKCSVCGRFSFKYHYKLLLVWHKK